VDYNNITLLYGLFNQYVFSEAKMNIRYLKGYYRSRRLDESRPLIAKLLNLIENYSYNDLTESRFLLTFQEDGKSEDEAKAIYNKIADLKKYSKEQSSVFIDYLRNICYSTYIERCRVDYEEDPVKYAEAIKKLDYKSNYSDTLVAKNFSELDVTDLVDRYSSIGYKSRYQFINDAYSSGGYVPGQLVVIAAAPSVGKSLFLQSEIVNFVLQDKRVHYLVMGDLNELDIAIRMMCQISHKSQRAIESDIIGNFSLYKDLFKDNLSITCVPSGAVSAREYVDWVKQRIDEWDILMVDYYGNFQKDDERSMYNQGGDICDALTELTRLGKLVFMACQPNKSYYREEFLPYEALAESSRIAQVSDMIITIGRNWDAGMRMGTFNIAKGRRCIADFVPIAHWIGTNEGLFYVCSDVLYAKYRSNKTQRHLYSYAELSAMDVIDEAIADSVEKSLENK
jgi:hypothetical protein